MPLAAIAFYGVGWQLHAETLAAYLAGRQPGDPQARWAELVPPYQALTGLRPSPTRHAGNLLMWS
jgi:hypothetical protein